MGAQKPNKMTAGKLSDLNSQTFKNGNTAKNLLLFLFIFSIKFFTNDFFYLLCLVISQ